MLKPVKSLHLISKLDKFGALTGGIYGHDKF